MRFACKLHAEGRCRFCLAAGNEQKLLQPIRVETYLSPTSPNFLLFYDKIQLLSATRREPSLSCFCDILCSKMVLSMWHAIASAAVLY